MGETITQLDHEDLQNSQLSESRPHARPFNAVISQTLAVKLPKMDSGNKCKTRSTQGGSTANDSSEDSSYDYD